MDGARREMIELDEAIRRVLASVPELQRETLEILEARGRVLMDAVHCEEPFPIADNSAMDGFGVRAAELVDRKRLRLVGESLAGNPYGAVLAEGACVRVMTGGLIPEGVDAVIPVEKSSGYEPKEDGSVEFEIRPEPGANIRRRACVRSQGDLLLARGQRIEAGAIGVLAQQGISRVAVGRRPKVAVLPTGDEVIPIDQKPQPGQVRNSNAYALFAQDEAAGAEAELLPVLADDEDRCRAQMDEALSNFDVVCTIGGVSMGTRDLVRPSFLALGGSFEVESIRIKPGKPTCFGALDRSGRRSYLLGLPGNPASTFTIFALLGVPFVAAFQGARGFQETGFGRYVGPDLRANFREQVLPARIVAGETDVELHAAEFRNSADLFSLAKAEVFYRVPPDTKVKEGDRLSWLRLS